MKELPLRWIMIVRIEVRLLSSMSLGSIVKIMSMLFYLFADERFRFYGYSSDGTPKMVNCPISVRENREWEGYSVYVEGSIHNYDGNKIYDPEECVVRTVEEGQNGINNNNLISQVWITSSASVTSALTIVVLALNLLL